MQPASPPLVTADTEQWYQSGEPLMYAGNYYYRAGAQVHFNGNEMVPTGFYRGVPLYSKTTIEPFSVVFVPVQGGVLQPYERRRTGEIAGLSGSSAPSFPVVSPSEIAPGMTPPPPITQGPPAPTAVGTTGFDVTPMVSSVSPAMSLAPAGASGRAATAVSRSPGAAPAVTTRRANAANGVFVEFDDARWFSSGPAVEFDARAFTRIGDLHGVPVYQARDRESTIFVPVAQGLDLVAPYSKRGK